MSADVWGVSMVKDEEDVIEQTLRHLHAEGLAGAVVLDNLSTDGTRAILDRLRDELFAPDDATAWLLIVDDPEVGYWQSAKMTAAARMALNLGASWVVPFDADEIWYSPDGRPLADAIPALGDDANVITAELFDHRCTALDPAPLLEGDDPFTRMGWRFTTPLPLPKVCVKPKHLHAIHPGNHGATIIGTPMLARPGLEVRHFPYRTSEQFIRKARNGGAAYAETTLERSTGQHWREYAETLWMHGEQALTDHFAAHFTFNHPAENGLIYDPAPIRVQVAE